MLLRERQIGKHLFLSLIEELSHTWEACPQLVGDATPLLARGGRVRLDEDGPNSGCHHLLRAFRHQAERIPHEMRPTTLPARTLEDRGDGALESLVAVTDDQLDTG